MIGIPLYNERQVKKRPKHQQYITVQSNPSQFGSGVGSSLGKLAGALKAREDEAAAASARDADNGYADWLRDYLYNEKTGFTQKEGEDAYKSRDAADADIEAARVRYGKGLTGDAAVKYNRASQGRRATALNTTIKHSGTQFNVWANNTQKARMQGYVNDAVLAKDDAGARGEQLAAGRAELEAYGNSRGMSDEQIQAMTSGWESGARLKIIEAMAVEAPMAAWRYYQGIKSEMTAEDRHTMETSPLADAVADNGLKVGAVKAGQIATPDDSPNTIERAKNPTASSWGETGVAPDKDDSRFNNDAEGEKVAPQASLRQVTRDGQSAYAFLASRSNKSGTAITGMREGFARNLAALIHASDRTLGPGLTIYSGYRSQPHQNRLFANAVKTHGSEAAAQRTVAKVSNHTRGIAADLMFNGVRLDKVSPRIKDAIHAMAEDLGMRFRMSYEPWHIEPGSGAKRIAPKPQARPNVPLAMLRKYGVTETTATHDDDPDQLSNVDGKGDMGEFNPDIRYLVEHVGPDDATGERVQAAMTGLEAWVLEEPDPILRSKRQAAANDLITQRQKARTAAAKAAEDTLWKLAMDGNYEQATTEMKTVAGRSAVSGIEDFLAKDDDETNEAAYYGIQRQIINNPDQFKSADLRYVRKHLSKADYKKVVDQQAKLNTPMAVTEKMKISVMMSTVEDTLRSAKIIQPAGDMTADDYATLGQFQAAFADIVDRFETANNRSPDTMELLGIADALLLPVTLGHNKRFIGIPIPGTTRESRLFQTPHAANDGDQIDIVVDYEDIPSHMRVEAAAQLSDHLGRTPTTDEVVQFYEDLLQKRLDIK